MTRLCAQNQHWPTLTNAPRKSVARGELVWYFRHAGRPPLWSEGELYPSRGPSWAELSPQVNYVKFKMVPEGYYKVLTQDDLGLLQMFHLSGIIDADIPDARLI